MVVIMAKKKKLSKAQKKQRRLSKGRQWLLTYSGSPKKIVKKYRKRFNVDVTCTLRDFKELGVEFSQEYLDTIKRNEQLRLQQRAIEKQKKQGKEFEEKYADSDDTFFYIAGYTSGGAPYGVAWEEMGMEPYGELEDEDIE